MNEGNDEDAPRTGTNPPVSRSSIRLLADGEETSAEPRSHVGPEAVDGSDAPPAPQPVAGDTDGLIHIDSKSHSDAEPGGAMQGPLYAAAHDPGLRSFKRDARYARRTNLRRRRRRWRLYVSIAVVAALVAAAVWWALNTFGDDAGAFPAAPERLPVVSRVATIETAVSITRSPGSDAFDLDDRGSLGSYATSEEIRDRNDHERDEDPGREQPRLGAFDAT